MAAKVNKYRKVQKRLGDSVEVDDAFDPEKYAARLEAFEAAELPEDDGWGRGKHGRLPPADADASPAGRGEDPDSAEPSDDDDEFGVNVVDRADEEDAGGVAAASGRNANPETRNPGRRTARGGTRR